MISGDRRGSVGSARRPRRGAEDLEIRVVSVTEYAEEGLDISRACGVSQDRIRWIGLTLKTLVASDKDMASGLATVRFLREGVDVAAEDIGEEEKYRAADVAALLRGMDFCGDLARVYLHMKATTSSPEGQLLRPPATPRWSSIRSFLRHLLLCSWDWDDRFDSCSCRCR